MQPYISEFTYLEIFEKHVSFAKMWYSSENRQPLVSGDIFRRFEILIAGVTLGQLDMLFSCSRSTLIHPDFYAVVVSRVQDKTVRSQGRKYSWVPDG